MGIKERRERDKLGTRQRILDAARDLFVEHGYDDVTMRKIAERIEYSPTAIYVHFEDKAALMTELSVCDFRAFTEALQRTPPSPDPLRRLQQLGMGLVQFAAEHPNPYRLLFMTQRPVRAFPEGPPPDQDAYQLLIDAVKAVREAGVVHPGWDADEVAQVLWGALHGIVSLQIVKLSNGHIQFRPIVSLCEVAMGALLTGFARSPAECCSGRDEVPEAPEIGHEGR